MRIRDLCDRTCPDVGLYDSVESIIALLIKSECVVVRHEGSYRGILTLNDVLRHSHQLVADCLTPKVFVDSELSAEQALQIIEKAEHIILPVQQDNQFIGVVTYKDILRAIFLENKDLKRNMLDYEKLEMLNHVTSGYIHDFNNILMAIQANLYLFISSNELNQDLVDVCEITKVGVDKAKNLLARLSQKDFSMEIQPVSVDLGVFIRDNVRYFTRSMDNIKITVKIDPDLFQLELDPVRFSQVLSNLFVNAKQAMPQGGDLEIAASNFIMDDNNPHLKLDPGSYILLTITDSGAGISDDDISKIFSVYFTTKASGSGLGLSQAREITEKHHGIINVVSEVGKGSCFSIYLPADRS